MGLIEKEGKVIPWQINDMINAKFDTIGGKNLGYFCVDCGGNSISKLEVDEEHGGHMVLQVFRCSREYGYRIDHVWEIRNLLDVSGVCPYKINTWYVFFPKSRKKIEGNSLNIRNLWGKSPGFCVGCGARMCHDAPADYRFCSILCKLSCPDAQQYYSAANWVNSVMPLLNRVSLATKKISMRSCSSNSGSCVTKEESGGELGSCFRLKIKPGVGIMRADSADQKLGKESQKRSRKRKLLGDMKEEEGQVNRKKRSKKAVSATGYRKSDCLSSAAQVVVISFRKRSRKEVIRNILLLSSKLKLLSLDIKGKGCIDVPIEQEVNLLVCYTAVGIRTPRVPVIHFVSKFEGTSRIYILNINTDREIVKLGMEDGRLIGFCAKGTGWLEYMFDDRIEFVNQNNEQTIVTTRPIVDVDQHEGLFSGSPGCNDFTSVLVGVNFVHGQQMQQRIDILVYRNDDWVPFVDIREVANAHLPLGMALEGKTLMVLDGSRRFYIINVDTFRNTRFEVTALLTTDFSESSIICVNNGWYVVIMTDDGRKLFQVDLEQEILVENVVLEDSVSIVCINRKQGFGYYAPVDSWTKGFIVARRESDREECRRYAMNGIYSVRNCSELTINSVCRCRFAFYIT